MKKGPLPGPTRRRIGKFEQCDKGTILLDEIGDMSLSTQAKILRVLQEGEFERIGGNETVKVDVRIFTSTNRKLEELIKGGEIQRRSLLSPENHVYCVTPPKGTQGGY